MIIDIHTHLGDILRPNGGGLIFRKGVQKQRVLDLITVAEWGMYNTNPVSEWLLTALCEGLVTKACHARNGTATLENCRRSMDENGVVKSACMPIAPYVTFDDLRKAMESDPGVIPFTSVDFSANHDPEDLMKSDVSAGARGLKLHPIIQKEPLTSRKTFSAVEAFAPHELPVLFHSGVQSYYLGKDKEEKQKPEYGDVTHAVKLCKDFPQVSFIVGHSGLFQYRETIDLFSGMKNVFVDTSFQPPKRIDELIKAFGPERVLYASDWPWGDRKTNIACVAKACRGDQSLEKLIYFENAAKLLKV
ncbi:MAG: amidohydrolase family protein [Desulfomonilaceae bacterium]|nr:amidohydrolase family protein [Desulfomonilaceae bacterium]